MSAVTAVRQLLAAHAPLTTLLGSTEAWPVWVWSWKPAVPIDGTGSVGVVVYQRGGWAPPSPAHNAQHPRICIDVYASPTLDDSGNIARRDAENRGLVVLARINDVLHRPQGGILGLTEEGDRMIESHRLDEVEFFDIPDSDGSKVMRVYYGVTLC